MRLLLDTQIFLWFVTGDSRLSASWNARIRDSDNDVWLSVVSVWEMIIKYQLGKLPLPGPAESYVPKQRERHGIASLPLSEASVTQLQRLPPLHRDPFDRMLICQSLSHGLTLVTDDAAILGYPHADIQPN